MSSKGRCKQYCHVYKTQVSQSMRDLYHLGLIRCHTCSTNIPKEAVIQNNKCPCCKCRVRLKPRNGNLKDQIIEMAVRI